MTSSPRGEPRSPAQAAPRATVASAQGIDVSSYQGPLTAANLKPYQFAFAKATEGLTLTDPHLAANLAAIKAAGIHAGMYHEYHPGADPVAQAKYFTAAVQTHGITPGMMFAVVASDYAGVTSAMIKTCCDEVAKTVGPRCPTLVYADLSVAKTLTTCTGYPLWLAYYAATPPPSVAPWKTWRLWQYSDSPEDKDAHNGTAADMGAWIAGYTTPAPVYVYGPMVPVWVTAGQNSLAALCTGTFHNAVSTVLRLTAERSPGGVYTGLTASYINDVCAASHLDVPAGTVVWHPTPGSTMPFTCRGDQTLQGLANAWKCQPDDIIAATAAKSPGAVFQPGMANFLNAVFTGSTLKVPAGISLFYEKS